MLAVIELLAVGLGPAFCGVQISPPIKKWLAIRLVLSLTCLYIHFASLSCPTFWKAISPECQLGNILTRQPPRLPGLTYVVLSEAQEKNEKNQD
jgi:hypothetical protein